MAKQSYKVWSADRNNKIAVVVTSDSNIYTEILNQASKKLSKNGIKLVLETDGTELDSETVAYFNQEPLIMLAEDETWLPATILSPSTSSSTLSYVENNSSFMQISSETPIVIADSEQQHQQISEICITVTEDYWYSYCIPWENLYPDFRNLLENNVKSKALINRVVDFVVDEVRKIKTLIPTKCFKIIARKMIDKYPLIFKDVDDDGVVLGDGTHSVLHKLVDRNNYLNRPHKRPLNTIAQTSKLPDRKKMLSAKAGCSNWQPEQLDEPDVMENSKQILQTFAAKEHYTSEEESTILENLEKTYSIQRKNLNEATNVQMKDIIKEWPIIFKEPFLQWHYKKLMGHSVSTLIDNLLRKQRKIIEYGSSKNLTKFEVNDENETEDVSIECIKIITKIFKEDFSYFMTYIEEGISLKEAKTVSSSPTILCFENRNGVFYHIYVEGININEGTMCFHKIFEQLFSVYYMCNMAYPTELSCTLEFIQRYFLKIHPDAGSKSKKQAISRIKVISLINKLKK